MKQRILVMNGQRLVQTEQGEEWNTGKVEKAGNLKAGIYNLYRAIDADKKQEYVGMILHTDNAYVYQQKGREVLRHDRQDFTVVPDYGSLKSIAYDEQGRAVTAAATATISQSIKR
ncbi:MAG: KfrB domain-containing protein [Nitrosospira sp.]